MSTILILNGSPNGKKGNGTRLIKTIEKNLPRSLKTKIIHLSEVKKISSIYKDIDRASGFIFVTGTYWDSWGSPLQKF